MTLQLINNTQRLVLNGSLMYQQDIKQFDLRLKINATERQTLRSWKLVDIKIDGCQLLATGRQRMIGMVYSVLSSMRSVGNAIPEKCPLRKVCMFLVDNIQRSKYNH